MRVLKIGCPECGTNAVIRKTNRKHPKIADVYCACSDVECGHTFVMNLTFSHTLSPSPSAKTGDIWLKAVVEGMNPQQRKTVLEFLQQPAA